MGQNEFQNQALGIHVRAFVRESAALEVVDAACFKAVSTKKHEAWCTAWVSIRLTVDATAKFISERGGLLLIGTNLNGFSE